MTFTPQLRIPGPTPLPEPVVRAQSRPMIDHRGPEFAALLHEVTEGAQRVFGTAGDLLVLTCSGTGGMESAVANLVSPGDVAVVALCGNFGERWVNILRGYGASVVALEAEWGQAVDPDDLREVLAAHPEASLVFLTHNETSTGVCNPLRELAAVARAADRLVVVDGVSSVSSMPIEVDAWGIDVAVSSSQKGWMAPPGIAFVSVSPRAWARREQARSPRFYLDWGQAREWGAKGMTPATPAVGVLFAVQEGIRMLEAEGLSEVYARHRRIAEATAAGLSALGFELFAAEGYRSPTVTAALPQPGVDVAVLRELLRSKYGVVIAGGQGKMSGKMIRIGHLGAVSEGDLVQVLWAIEQALEELDVAPAEGRAVRAASDVLGRHAVAAG
jgi:aspartate aminotransferase-like enzyme